MYKDTWPVSAVLLALAVGICSAQPDAFVRILPMTASNRTRFLWSHHLFRQRVEPTAANMPKLLWSNELEKLSEEHARKCTAEHTNLPDYSENFNVGDISNPYHSDPYATVKLWWDEKNLFDYDLHKCKDNTFSCYHYVQLVSAYSKEVGCAQAECRSVLTNGVKTGSTLVSTCTYRPRGGYVKYPPYEAGPPCSHCPNDRPSCEYNLCI